MELAERVDMLRVAATLPTCRHLAACVVLVALLAAPNVHADEYAVVDDDAYHEQIALADLGALALLYTAAKMKTQRAMKVVGAVAVGEFVVAPPLIHLLGHDRLDAAAMSMGLRLLAVAMWMWVKACPNREEIDPANYALCLFFRGSLALGTTLAVSVADVVHLADPRDPGEDATALTLRLSF